MLINQSSGANREEIMPDQRTFMYRRAEDGSVESRIFASPDAVPNGEGWEDSPAKCQDAPKKKRGRSPKAAEPTATEETAEVSDDDDG